MRIADIPLFLMRITHVVALTALSLVTIGTAFAQENSSSSSSSWSESSRSSWSSSWRSSSSWSSWSSSSWSSSVWTDARPCPLTGQQAEDAAKACYAQGLTSIVQYSKERRCVLSVTCGGPKKDDRPSTRSSSSAWSSSWSSDWSSSPSTETRGASVQEITCKMVRTGNGCVAISCPGGYSWNNCGNKQEPPKQKPPMPMTPMMKGPCSDAEMAAKKAGAALHENPSSADLLAAAKAAEQALHDCRDKNAPAKSSSSSAANDEHCTYQKYRDCDVKLCNGIIVAKRCPAPTGSNR